MVRPEITDHTFVGSPQDVYEFFYKRRALTPDDAFAEIIGVEQLPDGTRTKGKISFYPIEKQIEIVGRHEANEMYKELKIRRKQNICATVKKRVTIRQDRYEEKVTKTDYVEHKNDKPEESDLCTECRQDILKGRLNRQLPSEYEPGRHDMIKDISRMPTPTQAQHARRVREEREKAQEEPEEKDLPDTGSIREVNEED